MAELHIDTPESLRDLCRRLQGSEWLALDTEFVREKTYYPRFALLQVGNGALSATVDPLAIDLDPLIELLYDESIVKVFHAGRQDLEIFHHHWKRLPVPLFDTQPAAELAGLGAQIGYANLVQALLGHQLEKGHTRTDWSQRPLSAAQLRYALDDVIYLGEIYLKLRTTDWSEDQRTRLHGAWAVLADPRTYEPPVEDAWLKLKARKYLKGRQLEILKVLAAWRETEARRADKPRGWILSNEALYELSRRAPDSEERFKRIPGLTQGVVRRRGQHLLELIAQAAGD